MRGSLTRKLVILLLLVACTWSAYYFHFVLGADIVFTHLFYVPIVLGGLWWGLWGIFVPLFLAVLVVGSHLLSGISTPPTHDIVRGVMFIVVGYLVGKICAERKRHIRELKTTNGLKDLFSDILRHDLMNYVSGLDGVCELIGEEESQEEIEKEMEIIREESRNIKKMINDATVYSMLDSPGAMGFKKGNLEEIVRDAVRALDWDARKKGVQIVTRVEGEYPVMSNPFLSDVFSNLISNSIKYGPENSEVVIDVEDSDREWKVSVKDAGPGIPDKYKKDIFHRFQRRDKGGVRGSGLGLAIVEKVVRMHNGRVWVEDDPKGGSIFCVAIPKAE